MYGGVGILTVIRELQIEQLTPLVRDFFQNLGLEMQMKRHMPKPKVQKDVVE